MDSVLYSRPQRIKEWKEFTKTLQQAAKPGGALEEWVFHGTGARHLENIQRYGLYPAEVMTSVNGRRDIYQGVCIGSASMAIYFAEDNIESVDPPDDTAIVAMPLEVLDYSFLAIDESMIDSPCGPLKDRDENALMQAFQESARDWRASLEILQSFVCLDPIHPDDFYILQTPQDLNDLLNQISPQNRPG